MTKKLWLIILSCILAVIPSYYIDKNLYADAVIFIGCILTIIIILISGLKLSIKIACILIILYFYGRNIRIIISLFFTLYFPNKKSPLSLQVKKICDNNGLKIIENFSELPHKPTIFLANYCQNRIENIIPVLIPRKMAFLMREKCQQFNTANVLAKSIVVKGHHKGNFNHIEKEIVKAHQEGYDIFVYVTNMPYHGYIGRLRSGIFSIAQKNNITITPVAIDRIKTKYGIIFDQNLHIRVGKTFLVDTVFSAQYRTRKFLIKSLENFLPKQL